MLQGLVGSDRVIIRNLERDDLRNGFLTVLNSLRTTSDLQLKTVVSIFAKIQSNHNHIIAVARVDGQLVGAATLLIEPKFIHNGGKAGHIEDVVVRDDFQKCGIGSKIVEHLLKVATIHGCYKTTLDCTDDLVGFYEKIGFKRAATHMRINHTT